jgi:hypothetical protein
MTQFRGNGGHGGGIRGLIDAVSESRIGLNLCHKGIELGFGHRTEAMDSPGLATLA